MIELRKKIITSLRIVKSRIVIKPALIAMIAFCHITSIAQEKVITGIVTDEYNQPFNGALVCQTLADNCTRSNSFGAFQLIVNERYSSQLEISYTGYTSQIISELDTVSQILLVQITPKAQTEIVNMVELNSLLQQCETKYGFAIFFKANSFKSNFDNYTSILKEYNTNLMNKLNGFGIFSAVGRYRKYCLEISFGLQYLMDAYRDSLDLAIYSNQYGISFGYQLINMSGFVLSPKFAMNLNRYHLTNNNPQETIPLEQYMYERDLDIRFFQLTGSVGFDLSYQAKKMNKSYYTIGIYAGYIFKINQNPWMYSRSNSLSSEGEIRIDPIQFGFSISSNIDF